MIKGTRNQLHNVGNPYQGKEKRVLCVCSAGLLRSPTLAEYLIREYGYNTRACGTSQEYALIPISEALVCWADEIVFVSHENYLEVDQDDLEGKFVKVLNLPDQFGRNESDLVLEIERQYEQVEGRLIV